MVNYGGWFVPWQEGRILYRDRGRLACCSLYVAQNIVPTLPSPPYEQNYHGRVLVKEGEKDCGSRIGDIPPTMFLPTPTIQCAIAGWRTGSLA